MEQRYANILFDDAFKVVVCAPGNEPLLIKIVELLIPGKHIRSMELRDKENHGLSVSDKITTFDLFCTSETGEQFIVEMQYSPQKHYADRMLCYATYPIRAQLTRKMQLRKEKLQVGERIESMDYGLLPVYVVSLLNFSIPHASADILEEGLISRYEIRNGRNGELMTPALNFIYLELGCLGIKLGESEKCRTLLEKFAYSLKYMHKLGTRPDGFEEDLLKMLYDAAEFSNMTVEQQTDYETIMRTELDIIAEKAYARETGLAEGRAEGLSAGKAEGKAEGRAEGLAEGLAEGRAEAKAEIARKLLEKGFSFADITEITGLSEEEFKKIR